MPRPLGKIGIVRALCLILLILCACDASENTLFKRSAIISKQNASLRTDPMPSAPKLAMLPSGDKVKILKQGTNQIQIGKDLEYWYFVELANGIQGWIYGANLSFSLIAKTESSEEGDEGKFKDWDNFQERLTGKWWEITANGGTGYRKLIFWPDGKFVYAYGANVQVEGKFTIQEDKGMIVLDRPTKIGEELTPREVAGDLFLTGAKDSEEFRFRRGDSNPEDEEKAETEQSSDENGQSTEEKPSQESN